MFNTVWTVEREAVNFFYSADMISLGSNVRSAVNFVVWTNAPDLTGRVISCSVFLKILKMCCMVAHRWLWICSYLTQALVSLTSVYCTFIKTKLKPEQGLDLFHH